MPDQLTTMKQVRCKGRRDGQPCDAELCETDGIKLFFHLDSGKTLTIIPKISNGFGVVCELCKYENLWRE